MPDLQERLNELGIQLPKLPKPVAAYLPGKVTGNLMYASGQTPTVDGQLVFTGRLGAELSVEEGKQAARLACLNCLAELNHVLGSLDRVRQIIKVNGYVRSAEGFGAQPLVVNGASELLIEVFGETGRHARTAIGVPELPFGAPVEIELIAEIDAV